MQLVADLVDARQECEQQLRALPSCMRGQDPRRGMSVGWRHAAGGEQKQINHSLRYSDCILYRSRRAKRIACTLRTLYYRLEYVYSALSV